MKDCPISQSYGSPRWTGEISDCSLPVTLDTYSNCSFGCVYCFSQYQRAIGGAKEAYLNKDVKCVNVERVKRIFTEGNASQFSKYVEQKRPIQWGGLSDQFDGYEKKYGKTLELLRFFKEKNYPICFSTKSSWVFHDDRYLELFEGQDNWNMKFSIITLDEKAAAKIEQGVPTPKERLEAMRIYSNLNKGGATLRLRPFILGMTDKTYEDLIVAAHDYGATAVTTEFFCLERRSANIAKEHYDIISEVVGADIVDFYARHSKGSGYLRLNRKIKEPYVRKMKELCDKLGMRFYVSDAHFKECCSGSCCCGLPESWDYSRGNFSYALQLCKNKGEVRFSDIEKDMDFLDFMFKKAEGYNCNSTEKRAKFNDSTMKDYLRYLWNNPNAGQSPYRMFEGVMQPMGKDAEGNIVYVYDQSRTFEPQQSNG